MSFDQQDLTDRDNVEGESVKGRHLGKKTGSARCVFDASAGVAIGAVGLGLTVPKGAYIKRVSYKVLTTFESGGGADLATIALSVVGANDIVSAVAIGAATDWDAGVPKATLVTSTEASWLETAADSEVTATVAVEALTAGKLAVFLDWGYYDDL